MNLEKSFRSQWSEPLSEHGYTQVANVLLKNFPAIGITIPELVFIIICFMHKWTIKNPYPSLNTIANYMGVSRNSAQRYARSLERKGFLRRKYKDHKASEYDLSQLIKVLEYIAPHQSLDKEGIKNATELYLSLNTKEDPLRKINKEDIIKSL